MINHTLSGPALWTISEQIGPVYPQIYLSEREAQMAIVEDIEDDMQEFRDGDRDYDDIHQFTEYQACEIYMDEVEGLVVWDNDGNELISTTLKIWREQL